MKAFIDTSSFIKRYIDEEGSSTLINFLEKVYEIILAPVSWLEINSAIERRLREKSLTDEQAAWIRKEVRKDYFYVSRVVWNEQLEEKAVEYMKKYQLKTLDSLQLASGYLSKLDVFITSDKRLFSFARKEIKTVKFI